MSGQYESRLRVSIADPRVWFPARPNIDMCCAHDLGIHCASHFISGFDGAMTTSNAIILVSPPFCERAEASMCTKYYTP
jgi:hypothetical protein